jgi:hypothetical protein
MKLTKISTLVFLLLYSILIYGQERQSPKLIKSKGNYVHSFTKMKFPEQIDDYERKTIYSFTKANDDVEITYAKAETTTVAISLYPAGVGAEGRLRNEFLKTIKTVSKSENTIFDFVQRPVQRIGSKYVCNGFKAVSAWKTKNITADYILYECGTWFLKIIINSVDLDSSQVERLEEKILTKYDPTKLTELKPLSVKSDFFVAPALGSDRSRAKYILNSGLKKLKWAKDNVPENERASGFPDLYLNMHIEAFKEFAECKETGHRAGNDVAKLIDDVNMIINAGYLPEFIMKQYHMVMIVPDGMKLDFAGYEKFAKEHNNPALNINTHYYLIVYRQKK